jgi:hypothetical protein
MFDDHTIEWLNKRGYLTWGRHRQAEAIIAPVNAVIGRQRWGTSIFDVGRSDGEAPTRRSTQHSRAEAPG